MISMARSRSFWLRRRRGARSCSPAPVRLRDAPADVDETPHAGETPEVYALRVAPRRRAPSACRHSGSPILAADTVVVVNGRILGKPRDREDAGAMLKSLSGAIHRVLTAVVVRSTTGKSAIS